MTHTVRLSSDRQRQRAISMILTAPEGYVATVREQTRTGEQNDKMWAMLTDIARSRPMGREHTPDVWKAILMQAFGHEQVFEMGIDGRPFPMGFRSSQMTKQEMSDFIEWMHAWGAQVGVKFTDQSGE